MGQKVTIMRVSISLTDANGDQFTTSGNVNVFRNRDGKLTTGRKAYTDSTEAQRRCRPPTGATRLGSVNLAEYVGNAATMIAAEAAARKAAIAVLDSRLETLLGIAPVVRAPAAIPATSTEVLPSDAPVTVPAKKASAKKKPAIKAKTVSKVKASSKSSKE